MGQLPGRVTCLPPLPPPPPGACLTLNNTALLCSACLPWRRKVAVLGAAGGIGQPLSLLLKMNRMITELSLYDIANVAGVAADLSHCNTNTKVGRVGLLGLVGLLGSVKVKAGGQCAAGQMMQEHACSHCVHSKLSQPAAHPPALQLAGAVGEARAACGRVARHLLEPHLRQVGRQQKGGICNCKLVLPCIAAQRPAE